MAIERVPVRASISGAGFSASTPNIISIYIRKTRNELSTFNFSIKTNSAGSGVGGQVNISIGGGIVFTGIVTACQARPCFDDPGYSILDASGTDIRKLLENKQFTRRCTDTASSWALITGVVRKGLKSQKLQFTARSNLGSNFYVSPDTLNNGGLRNTSKVVDYLGQSSTSQSGGGGNFEPIQAYAYPIGIEGS